MVSSVWTLLGRAYRPTERSLLRATSVGVAMCVLIIVTGGLVRLTSSGLGCLDWPTCEGGRFAPSAESGVHGLIEFSNRLLTFALCAVVGWVILSAGLQTVRRRSVMRGAWAQFWLIVGNAFIGGITVWTKLNPYTVASHFLLATALLTVTMITWQRAREGDGPVSPLVPPAVYRMVWMVVCCTGATVALGTVATGSGPHAGDSADVPRMPVDWYVATGVHAALAAGILLTTTVLLVALRVARISGPIRARAWSLLAALAFQGAVGAVQSATHLPYAVVILHLFAASLVWIGALRLLFSARERSIQVSSEQQVSLKDSARHFSPSERA